LTVKLSRAGSVLQAIFQQPFSDLWIAFQVGDCAAHFGANSQSVWASSARTGAAHHSFMPLKSLVTQFSLSLVETDGRMGLFRADLTL